MLSSIFLGDTLWSLDTNIQDFSNQTFGLFIYKRTYEMILVGLRNIITFKRCDFDSEPKIGVLS